MPTIVMEISHGNEGSSRAFENKRILDPTLYFTEKAADKQGKLLHAKTSADVVGPSLDHGLNR